MLPALARVFASALALATGSAQAQARYATQGQCGGLPAMPLRVAAGFCAGLAAQRLGTPRGVLPLADGRVLVADLGRWDGRTGRLLELTPTGQGYRQRTLLGGLDRPHGLRQGPAGDLFIGEAGRISRVHLAAATARMEPLIDGLPTSGRHPLKSFVVAPDGALIVNRGAPSDHCEITPAAPGGRFRPCAEAEGEHADASLWRYAPEGGRWVGRVLSRGLRNSMALAFDAKTGQLWQAENSRDVLPAPGGDSEAGPHDELNRVLPGAHHGWPYCHDRGVPDPAFGRVDCGRYTPPERLLPPHSAPLGMVFYDAPQAPAAWRRTLVITLHGYRAQGHRIVGYALDDAGRPAAEFMPLVDGWRARPGHRPLGAPTDIQADAQGRLWVTEDRNGTLLVISPGATAR